LLVFLPTREGAERLCDLYLEYGRHMYVLPSRPAYSSNDIRRWDGIPRDELYEEVLDSVYNQYASFASLDMLGSLTSCVENGKQTLRVLHTRSHSCILCLR